VLPIIQSIILNYQLIQSIDNSVNYQIIQSIINIRKTKKN